MFKLLKIFIVGGCLALLFLVYIFLEPYWVQIKQITISDTDIPAAFEGLKIVFISDIHHGPFFSIKRVRRLAEKINRLQPDIVIFGGDYVHRNAKYIIPCFDELIHVKAPLGKFGVLGNHDHWEDVPLTLQNMKKAGITILDNRAEWIVRDRKRIKIGGVGDLWEDIQNLSPTIDDTKEDDFVILVSHNPDYAEQITTRKIDLMLSGHTHGGQVTFFGLWAPLVPSRYGQKYRTGIVETGVMTSPQSGKLNDCEPPQGWPVC